MNLLSMKGMKFISEHRQNVICVNLFCVISAVSILSSALSPSLRPPPLAKELLIIGKTKTLRLKKNFNNMPVDYKCKKSMDDQIYIFPNG